MCFRFLRHWKQKLATEKQQTLNHMEHLDMNGGPDGCGDSREVYKWLHFPMKNPVTEQKRESFHCQGLDYSANAACWIGHFSSIYRSQCSEHTSINFNSENRFA